MPLKITLKPGERMVLSGAVVTNGSNRKCELLINNNAPVLREKDILAEKDAYWQLVGELLEAASSQTGIVDQISENIVNGRYYQALKLAGDLIEYEQEVLRNVR